jgi:hypothetical protein
MIHGARDMEFVEFAGYSFRLLDMGVTDQTDALAIMNCHDRQQDGLPGLDVPERAVISDGQPAIRAGFLQRSLNSYQSGMLML